MPSHNHPRFSDPDFETNLMPVDSRLHFVDEYDDDACVTDAAMTPEQQVSHWQDLIDAGQLLLTFVELGGGHA